MNDMNLLGKFSNPCFFPKKTSTDKSIKTEVVHPIPTNKKNETKVWSRWSVGIWWWPRCWVAVWCFFRGDEWKGKNAGSRNPNSRWRKGGVFGICCCYLGFCFFGLYCLLCTLYHDKYMINHHQTTSWENIMFGTCSKHLKYLKEIQVDVWERTKKKTNVTSVSLGGMVHVFVN